MLRLDGQYGDAVAIAQLIEAGVYLLTRGRTYGMLERPQLQRVLTHPPSARVTALNTGEVVELFALWLAAPRRGVTSGARHCRSACCSSTWQKSHGGQASR